MTSTGSALAFTGVGTALLVSLALWGQATQARTGANAAADLAAVSAATAYREGREPCLTAKSIASANRARLVSCQPSPDGNVTVRVAYSLGWAEASASARAGPLEAGAGASEKTGPADSSVSAPGLESGSLPLPHLGETTQAGQPAAQGQ